MSEEDLFEVIKSNNIEEAKRLIFSSGLSIKCYDECERTPLHFACTNEMCLLLISVDPTAFSVWMKEQQLIEACLDNNLYMAKGLVRSGVSLKCRDRSGRTPMNIAVSEGHMGVATWLFSLGASVNDKDEMGLNPMHWVFWSCNKNLAEWLLSVGASLNDKDKCGRTPLHLASSDVMRDFLCDIDPAAYSAWEREQHLIEACKRGDLDEAKRLISSGVSVNCRDKNGCTPMHRAAEVGRREVAEWLLSLGASFNDKNEEGRTPMHVAVSYCKIEVAEWLFNSGASVIDKDAIGWTPMHLAALEGHKEVAEWLLRLGASLNDKDQNGKTALMMAVSRNNQDTVRLLLNMGAAWNQKNNFGKSALLLAVESNKLEIARLLVDRGADMDEEEARAALYFAREKGRHEMVNLVTKHLKWIARRDFLMFLATQSYLPPAPPPLADFMFRDELNIYYQQCHNPETRPLSRAVHSVFFMEDMQRYIMSFLGPE